MSQNINLYDESLRLQRTWLALDVTFFAVVLVTALLAGVSLLFQWQADALDKRARAGAEQLKIQQGEMQALSQKIASATPDPRLLAELASIQTTLTQRRVVLDMLNAGGLGNDVGYTPVLRAFARQTMSGVWLTGLNLNHRDVALRGRALDPELIPAYLRRLDQESALQGRSFRALEIQRPASAAPTTTATAATTAAPAGAAPSSSPPSYVEFALLGAQSMGADKEWAR